MFQTMPSRPVPALVMPMVWLRRNASLLSGLLNHAWKRIKQPPAQSVVLLEQRKRVLRSIGNFREHVVARRDPASVAWR